MVRVSAQPRDRGKARIIGNPRPVVPYFVHCNENDDSDNHNKECYESFLPVDYQRKKEKFNVRNASNTQNQTLVVTDEKQMKELECVGMVARQVLDAALMKAQACNVSTNDIVQFIQMRLNSSISVLSSSSLNMALLDRLIFTNVNEVAFGGIPDDRILQTGDLLSIDIRLVNPLNGLFIEVCDSVVIPSLGNDDYNLNRMENIDGVMDSHKERAEALVKACRDITEMAISQCRAGEPLTSVGTAVYEVANEFGYQPVRKVDNSGVAMLGVESLNIHYFQNTKDENGGVFLPGMVFVIGPIIVEGHFSLSSWRNGCTFATKDSGLAAQLKQTVCVDEEGIRILTIKKL